MVNVRGYISSNFTKSFLTIFLPFFITNLPVDLDLGLAAGIGIRAVDLGHEAPEAVLVETHQLHRPRRRHRRDSPIRQAPKKLVPALGTAGAENLLGKKYK